MRWGVRKDRSSSGGQRSTDIPSNSLRGKIAEKQFTKRATSVRTYFDVWDKTAPEINKILPEFNKPWEGKDMSNPKTEKAYHEAFGKVFAEVANKHLKATLGGTTLSPTGQREFSVVFNPDSGTMHIVEKQVKHESAVSFNLKVMRDKRGLIVRIEAGENELAQSDIDIDPVVAHYGVKGMRWGVRKDRSSSKKSKPKRVEDMSDEELKKAVNRLNLEQNYTSLIAKKNERNQTAIQRGAKMVQKAVVDAAVQKGTQIAAKQMTKGLELASFVVMEAAKKRKK